MPTILDLDQEQSAPQSHYPRARRELELPPGRARSRGPLWAAIVALIAGLGGLGWHSASRMDGQEGRIGESAGAWRAALTAVRQQITAGAERLAALRNDVDGLRNRLESVDARITSGVERAQRTSRDLGASIRSDVASLRRESRDAGQGSAARVAELEAQHQAQLARTAELEREVARLNTQVAGLRTDLNIASDGHAKEAAQLRGELRQEASRVDKRVDQVASFNNRPRGRFEAAKGGTQEIAPGMLLHITKVDPRFRRFDGWLQLVNDSGRFIWLRDQSMLQSVPFYTGTNALRNDLVVTDLNNGGVTGYVIFPSMGAVAASN